MADFKYMVVFLMKVHLSKSEVILRVGVEFYDFGVFVVLEELFDLLLLEFRRFRVFPSCGNSQRFCVDDPEDIKADDHAAKDDSVH